MTVRDWTGIINDCNGRLIGHMNVFPPAMLMTNIYHLSKEWCKKKQKQKTNPGFCDLVIFR